MAIRNYARGILRGQPIPTEKLMGLGGHGWWGGVGWRWRARFRHLKFDVIRVPGIRAATRQRRLDFHKRADRNSSWNWVKRVSIVTVQPNPRRSLPFNHDLIIEPFITITLIDRSEVYLQIREWIEIGKFEARKKNYCRISMYRVFLENKMWRRERERERYV